MEWNDKKTVKKGNIGEDIINEYLKNKGLVVYEPITDNAHGFDRLVSKGKEKLIIVEIKTKAKRNYFPDTRINYKHYLEYKSISKKHNLPVWLFFVDEMIGKIYGENLEFLEKPDIYEYNGKNLSYPKVEQHSNSKIIYFYQPNMREISILTEEQIDKIKSFSTRNYNYK